MLDDKSPAGRFASTMSSLAWTRMATLKRNAVRPPSRCFLKRSQNQRPSAVIVAGFTSEEFIGWGPGKVSSSFPVRDWSEPRSELPSSTQLSFLRGPFSLTDKWRRLAKEATGGIDSRQTIRSTGGGEFHRIREWHTGDQPRAIHWRSSAKRGDLMVKEFERDEQRKLCLMLDLWRPDGDNIEIQELAVRFMATALVRYGIVSERTVENWTDGP